MQIGEHSHRKGNNLTWKLANTVFTKKATIWRASWRTSSLSHRESKWPDVQVRELPLSQRKQQFDVQVRENPPHKENNELLCKLENIISHRGGNAWMCKLNCPSLAEKAMTWWTPSLTEKATTSSTSYRTSNELTCKLENTLFSSNELTCKFGNRSNSNDLICKSENTLSHELRARICKGWIPVTRASLILQ